MVDIATSKMHGVYNMGGLRTGLMAFCFLVVSCAHQAPFSALEGTYPQPTAWACVFWGKVERVDPADGLALGRLSGQLQEIVPGDTMLVFRAEGATLYYMGVSRVMAANIDSITFRTWGVRGGVAPGYVFLALASVEVVDGCISVDEN